LPEKLGDPQILFKPITSTGSGNQIAQITLGRRAKILMVELNGSAEWSAGRVAIRNEKSATEGKIIRLFDSVMMPTKVSSACRALWHGIAYCDYMLEAVFPAGTVGDTYQIKALVRFVE